MSNKNLPLSLLALIALGSLALLLVYRDSWINRLSSTSTPSSSQPANQAGSTPPNSRPALSGDDREILDAFDRWLAEYRVARQKGPVPDSLIRRGADLAQRRKPVLLSLLRSDPQKALARMVPRTDYPFLPSAVLSHTETPLDAVLPYSFAVACGGVPREERVITWQGSHLPVHTYGHRLGIGSKKHLPVHGFMLEKEVAMDASPVRRADPRRSRPCSLP